VTKKGRSLRRFAAFSGVEKSFNKYPQEVSTCNVSIQERRSRIQSVVLHGRIEKEKKKQTEKSGAAPAAPHGKNPVEKCFAGLGVVKPLCVLRGEEGKVPHQGSSEQTDEFLFRRATRTADTGYIQAA